MKVLLVVTVLVALYCAVSEASSLDTLKRLVKKVEEEKKAEIEQKRLLEKKEKEDNLIKKLEEILGAEKTKKGWLSNAWDSVVDQAENIGEGVSNTFNSGEESELHKEIDLPDNLMEPSNDPCDRVKVLQESSGNRITFPATGNYHHNEICEWVINSTGSGDKIKVEFGKMDIFKDDKCEDYIEIYEIPCRPDTDGNFQGTRKLGRSCGGLSDLPEKKFKFKKQGGNCVYIKFRSSLFQDSGEGFMLDYEFY